MLMMAVIVMAGLLTVPITYWLSHLVLVDADQRTLDRRFDEIVANWETVSD